MTAKKQNSVDHFRQAISYQIRFFRTRHLSSCGTSFISDLSGERFHVSCFRVDYMVPFQRLVEDFCEQENVNLKGSEIICPFFRKPLFDRWKKYHQRYAILRIVSETER